MQTLLKHILNYRLKDDKQLKFTVIAFVILQQKFTKSIKIKAQNHNSIYSYSLTVQTFILSSSIT